MDVRSCYWLGSLFYISFLLEIRFSSFSKIYFNCIFWCFKSFTNFDNNFIFWVSFAAISPGIIAFSLYTLTQKYLGASTTGFTLYLFTVYGAFYGIFLFQEKLELFHYIGTILVFFGIFLVKKKIKNA